MNAGKFSSTFTSWSGLKDYFTDTKLLFTEGLSHFEDMTWDKAKLENIELEITETNNAIVVLSPTIDDKTMLINFVYQTVGAIDIIIDTDGFNTFIYELMSDTDFMLLMKNEYDNGFTGFKRISSEILDKFRDFIIDNAQNLLIPDADALVERIMIIKQGIEAAGNVAGMLFSWLTYESFAFEVVAEFNNTPLPTDGLVAYYPFNGNANDESGNEFNAINFDNITWTNGDATMTTNSIIEFSGDIITNENATYLLDINIDNIAQKYYYGIKFWVNGGDIPVFTSQSGQLIYTNTWWDDHGLDLDINQDGNDYHKEDTYQSSDNTIDADRYWNIDFQNGFTLHDFNLWTDYFYEGSIQYCWANDCSYNPHGVLTIWNSDTYYDFSYTDYGEYNGFYYGYYFPTFNAAPIMDAQRSFAIMADSENIYIYTARYTELVTSFPYNTGQCKVVLRNDTIIQRFNDTIK